MSSSDYHTTTSNTNTAINQDIGNDINPTPTSMQFDKSPQPGTVEAAATNDDCDNKTNNIDNLDRKDDTSLISGKTAAGNTEDGKTKDVSRQENDGKDESSTLSTAFTISFEDESASTSKKFGIRDSIRKFAPPKPNTIEKPRTGKSDTQENSYASIESSPGSLSKQSFHRTSTNNTSCRSSGRKSDSSRHSNISESAAFLIDRMLNCNQGESVSSMCLESNNRGKARSQSNRSKCGSATKKVIARSSDAILDGDASGAGDGDDGDANIDDEVDFCEDKSDNGTYIVGAEPESDAARKKIDELFGVVKAAEQSIIAASKAAKSTATVGRQNIVSDRRPFNRERQERIDRLARGRNRSPSSSSSGRDIGLTGHRARSATRKSRNSSCDRESKLPSSKTRRAASQSSRQSSHPGLSDGDTQSSRSSLHADLVETSNIDVQTANHPSMKFNRAFALRRARLGLGEPNTMNRLTSTPASYPTQEPDSSLNISPRRAVNVSAQRYGQTGSSGQQQSLGRNDGGRFSLRMKKNPLPSRLGGLNSSVGRVVGHQGAIIDSYINKVFTTKAPSSISNQSSPSHQNSHHTPISMPYQSNEELEGTSSSRYRSSTAKTSDTHPTRKTHHLSEIEGDNDYCGNRFNYSLGGVESELYSSLVDSNMRSCSSAGRQIGSSGQLGALDCLVVSAISSLSVKIRTSVCDLMVEHAKRLPAGNETRSVVEEILPQLTAASSRPKSPTSIEEIDQSLHFDLAQTLKNLKKVEQIVDVMRLISNQTQHNSVNVSSTTGVHRRSRSPGLRHQATTMKRVVDGGGETSNGNSEANSLSPV